MKEGGHNQFGYGLLIVFPAGILLGVYHMASVRENNIVANPVLILYNSRIVGMVSILVALGRSKKLWGI